MGLGSTIGTAVGKVVVKLGLKRAYRWGRRWYYHNIRGEKTPEEKLEESAKRIEELEEREREKEQRIISKEEKIEEREEEISEVRRDLSVKERLMESLEIEGISRQELFRKNLDNPTPFLIFRLGGQRSHNSDEDKWVRNKLESGFGAETVGSSYVISPENFPEDLLRGKLTLPEWIKTEIDEEDKEANFVYVTWVDLEKGELYWRADYKSTSPMQDLQDRFDMSELAEKDFYKFDEVKDALQLVKKGDIAFFSAKFVDENEIKRIHENQANIEEELQNPNLKEIVNQIEVGEIDSALEPYVTDPENVARGVKQEAKIWYEELYRSSESPE